MAKQNLPARGPRRGDRYTRFVIGGIILSIAVIALVLWNPFERFRGTEKRPPQKPAKQEHAEKKRERTGRVSIVIDDLGQDLKPARELLALEKVTFSVMPGLPQSKKVADLARRNGHEVLLHLPMEPKNGNGKKQAAGILRSDMTPTEFITTIAEDIASVPGAAGVNNHEGSALTENKEAMKYLMKELQERDLRFLDSLTSPQSIAYATAKEFGVKTAKRDVFLDNENDNPAAIRKQLAELTRIVRKNGKAIGIGHPFPSTISELKKWLAEAEKEGIEVVPVSKLMQ